MLKGKIKSSLILIILLVVIFSMNTIIYAHSVDLDPESLISMPWMIIGGSATVYISSSVTDYNLYFQAVNIDSSDYAQIKKIEDDSESELNTLKEAYTTAKTEMNDLREKYNTARDNYNNGLSDDSLSDEEKQTLKTAYETAQTNYNNKVTEYNEKVTAYNNKVDEVNSNIKALTPMYNENNWTQTTDNKVTIDTTKFSGEQPYTLWIKLVTGTETYYDESIYTISGTKVEDVNVTGISLNKTSLILTEGESYTLEATITPSDATNKEIIWESDNESIATVENGKITAKSIGTTTITATTDDGSYAATCKVEITKSETTNSSQKTEDDTTISQNSLPYTGISKIVILIIIFFGIISVLLYKKYKFYNI